jgi:hypothetical protein
MEPRAALRSQMIIGPAVGGKKNDKNAVRAGAAMSMK